MIQFDQNLLWLAELFVYVNQCVTVFEYFAPADENYVQLFAFLVHQPYQLCCKVLLDQSCFCTFLNWFWRVEFEVFSAASNTSGIVWVDAEDSESSFDCVYVYFDFVFACKSGQDKLFVIGSGKFLSDGIGVSAECGCCD